MRFVNLRRMLKTATLAAAMLFVAATASFAQGPSVSITAQPQTALMPDGTSVPMWGYTCSSIVTPVGMTCAYLNQGAATAGLWSPIVLTVPYNSSGTNLSINLTNNLSFTPATVGATTNNIPTSIVIVGQLGGGLGQGGTSVPSPSHISQPSTWPIANGGATFTPPPQGNRVQSFGTEVSFGTPQTLNWANLRPGTYLFESGTHPSIQVPMGLYGILVVTQAPASSGVTGTAYPAAGSVPPVTYNADVDMVLSEMDPVQNNAVNTAVNTNGFNENGTYGPMLGGAITTILVTNPGSGYVAPPTVTITPATCTATATANIDANSTSPTYGQVTSITVTKQGQGCTTPNVTLTAPTTIGGITATASATGVLGPNSLSTCQNAAACYPPAVDYTPLYYMINGVAFSKAMPAASVFSVGPFSNITSGSILVRLVNAGLRMHVPTIVNSATQNAAGATVGGFTLVAEDGNPLPGMPRVQSEVFLAAGKTYDVKINAPATATTFPVFDRELSLSGNSTTRDAGMLAYISDNGGTVSFAATVIAALANPDTYTSVYAGQTLSVTDPAKGVLANDANILGVKPDATLPAGHGIVTLNANGTFTYVPDATWASGTTTDTFGYCGNGATT